MTRLKIIGSPLDFVGINVYTPTLLVIAFDRASGISGVPFNDFAPKDVSSWHRLAPESRVLGAAAAAFPLEAKGDLHHRERLCGERHGRGRRQRLRLDRLMYLRNGMLHQQRATAEGFP